jgi:glycosyltransferase involved in cell wall biosynthesis
MENPPFISVVIPTSNRPTLIQDFLCRCVSPYHGHLFRFFIFDGSSDDKTEKVVNYYAKKCKNSISYFACSEPTAEKKIQFAFSRLRSSYYYVFGDGIIADFALLESFLLSIEFFNYSVLSFSFAGDRNLKRYLRYPTNSVFNFDSPASFVSTCSVPMVLFGGSIISDEVKMRIVNLGLLEKYNHISSCFGYPFSVFDAIADGKGRRFCFFYSTALISSNPLRKVSGWYSSGKVLDTFCKNYYQSILLLDPAYDSIRKGLFKVHWRQTYLLSIRNILMMRSRQYKNISFHLLQKYHFYINRTIPRPWRVYLSLLIPSFIPSLIISIHRHLKKQSY